MFIRRNAILGCERPSLQFSFTERDRQFKARESTKRASLFPAGILRTGLMWRWRWCSCAHVELVDVSLVDRCNRRQTFLLEDWGACSPVGSHPGIPLSHLSFFATTTSAGNDRCAGCHQERGWPVRLTDCSPPSPSIYAPLLRNSGQPASQHVTEQREHDPLG